MNEKMNGPQENEALSRHQRKCLICHHPDREAIEDDFIHWRNVWRISQAFDIADYRSIYRHARATGLIPLRRQNLHCALDEILENARDAKVTADGVIHAIRAYSCLDDLGRWTEPPKHVNFTVARTVHTSLPLEIPATPPQSVSHEEAVQSQSLATPSETLEVVASTISDEGFSVPSVARGNSTNEMATPALASAAPRGATPAPHRQASPVPTQHRQSSSPLASVGFRPPNLIYGTGIRNEAMSLKT